MSELYTQVHIQYDSEGRLLPFDARTEQLYFTFRAMEHLAERLLDIQRRHNLPPIIDR